MSSGQYSSTSGFTAIRRITSCKDDLGKESMSICSKIEIREENVVFQSKHCLSHQNMQTFNQRRAKSENNILESLKNSEAMIQESIECGVDCSEELYRQREQLERTSCHLDEIEVDLRANERHIRGISSFFGGMISNVKNKLPSRKISLPSWSSRSKHGIKVKIQDENDKEVIQLEDEVEVGIDCVSYRNESFLGSDPFNDVVDGHLNSINNNLMSLKRLAVSLGSELDLHNDLLDGLNDKVEKTNAKIEKQRKSVDGLLK